MLRAVVTVLALLSMVPAAAGEELLVFAAASLTDALEEIGRAYEAVSGDDVVFSFGASSDLARQIRAGAPADVFFSADVARMEELEAAGLVDRGARLDVLTNELAIVVPKDSDAALTAASDLAAVKRLALADPEAAPAGIYARTYLTRLGLWDTLRDRIVPAVDVRAALAAVESGHVDAGIVYRTDAAVSSRVRVAFEVPRDQGPPIVYALAPVAASRKRATADLVRHLSGPQVAATYERFGFRVLIGR